MQVYILIYSLGDDEEGIHSLEIKGDTIVLMFEDRDDAERYCGLLEAQDFPKPLIELINRDEVVSFCSDSGYEAKFVEKGFLPKTDEERLLLSPPERNLDVSTWQEKSNSKIDQSKTLNTDNDLDSFRKRLEDLL
ncbi:DUF3110 domain-containing protein [Prochlorococcus marinus]|uniref:DUF3110 domain-containing protein n=1 Tax=Prochlorococcus marinus (strain MIT 9211) TaxID=93059 RepID=A9BAD7_PROM4|nr:DUF3110 domain-containing protein [Prochlorococcus marinus]ABX08799.1 conserved hypothetical protein [Prochlorococcus marinus str. MIT 9211]